MGPSVDGLKVFWGLVFAFGNSGLTVWAACRIVPAAFRHLFAVLWWASEAAEIGEEDDDQRPRLVKLPSGEAVHVSPDRRRSWVRRDSGETMVGYGFDTDGERILVPPIRRSSTARNGSEPRSHRPGHRRQSHPPHRDGPTVPAFFAAEDLLVRPQRMESRGRGRSG